MIVRRVIDRSAAILLQPHLYFTCNDDFMDFGEGTVYAAIMGTLSVVLAIVMGGDTMLSGSLGLIPTLIISPMVAVLGTFVMAGIIHVLCQSLGSRSDFGDSFHVSASASVFIPISQVLSDFPLIVLSMGWAWWVVSRGVIHGHKVEPRRAEIVFGLLYISLLMLSATAH
ncbi:MAG: Yip1 family protein [Luminiphilus sp.]|nr:Yip1 family protein [Luminiphilus sp.]